MKTICWNSRGLGNPSGIRALRDLIAREGPDLLFLQETKLSTKGMDALKCKLGFVNCFSVDSEGRSGGLGLLWNSDLGVELRSFSQYHIDVHIKIDDLMVWRFTGLYGHPDTSRRTFTWNLIRTLSSIEQLPWLVGGDLNEVLHPHEKRGGRDRPVSQIEAFREVLTECELRDLGYKGQRFTWWNGRGGNAHIFEHLDRFVGNDLLTHLFPHLVVQHGNVAHSDHIPILFESSNFQPMPRRPKQFHLEAMWVGEEQCERIIEQVWSERGGNRGMEDLLNLIQGCGQQLKIWNRHSFGLVKKKLNEARAELEKAQFSHSHDPNPKGLSQAINKVQLWLEREEVMWRQRSRIQWLKEGDQNTRFFHSSASMRRKRNTIQGLKDDQGHLTEGAQRDKLIVDFFEDLCTSTT
ncbi:uncharacterized protein LOC122282426 [Carya illinoinensis]|nr:uncharacterized protein LOC122282426 [Carya illinoinensis]